MITFLYNQNFQFMGMYSIHQVFYDKPIRISKEEQIKPLEVIRHFCGAYHLHEIRQYLSDSLEVALTTENCIYEEAESRNSLLVFYRQLEEALEAIYLINGLNQEKNLCESGLKKS